MATLRSVIAGWLPRTGVFEQIVAEDLRHSITISLWIRYSLWLTCLAILVYRPDFPYSQFIVFASIAAVVMALNGYVHYRLFTNKGVSWCWMLALSAADVVLSTVGMLVAGEFRIYFYVVYYPVLAIFAVVFSYFKLGFAWTTMVIATYVAVSLIVGQGLDIAMKEEKALFARIAVMYAEVAAIILVMRYERARRIEAVQREQELLKERIDLSQSMHDTTAQSAFIIGLGIESAIEMAEEKDNVLADKLRATHSLLKSTMWELRRPIDMGYIFDGRLLGSALGLHVATFTSITSVFAELTLQGLEPSLSPTVRSSAFSIAHNALTNAYRHSHANQVEISVEFGHDRLQLSVSDDGVGLPEDYWQRGHGFRNMEADATQLGGTLHVESGEAEGGTTVSCVIPYHRA